MVLVDYRQQIPLPLICLLFKMFLFGKMRKNWSSLEKFLLPITLKPALPSVYSISLSGILGLLIAKPRSHFCFPPLHYTVCYETLLIPTVSVSIYCDRPIYYFYKWLLPHPGSNYYQFFIVYCLEFFQTIWLYWIQSDFLCLLY